MINGQEALAGGQLNFFSHGLWELKMSDDYCLVELKMDEHKVAIVTAYYLLFPDLTSF